MTTTNITYIAHLKDTIKRLEKDVEHLNSVMTDQNRTIENLHDQVIELEQTVKVYEILKKEENN